MLHQNSFRLEHWSDNVYVHSDCCLVKLCCLCTFCIFGLLVLKALVQLACMIVESFHRLMKDLVLGCYRCVNALHCSIKLIIWYTSFHVPERDTTFSFIKQLEARTHKNNLLAIQINLPLNMLYPYVELGGMVKFNFIIIIKKEKV